MFSLQSLISAFEATFIINCHVQALDNNTVTFQIALTRSTWLLVVMGTFLSRSHCNLLDGATSHVISLQDVVFFCFCKHVGMASFSFSFHI